MPPWSPCTTRNGPESTSSRTARFGVRAISTASPMPWTVSTWTIRDGAGAHRQTDPGAPHGRPIRRKESVQVRDFAFQRTHSDKTIKFTIPGAFTMAKMAFDEHYGDQETLIMAYAKVLNEEAREMKAAGADAIADYSRPPPCHPRPIPIRTALTSAKWRSTRIRARWTSSVMQWWMMWAR